MKIIVTVPGAPTRESIISEIERSTGFAPTIIFMGQKFNGSHVYELNFLAEAQKDPLILQQLAALGYEHGEKTPSPASLLTKPNNLKHS